MRSRAIHTNTSYLSLTTHKNKKRTVDLLEHLEHRLNVVVVQEPRLGVPVILLERHAERVGNVDRLPVVLPEQHADDALRRAARDAACMMVRHGEQDERVHD